MLASRSFACAALMLSAAAPGFAQTRLQSSDLLKLRSVSAVQLSPDATRVAYVIENNDGDGRPYGQLWVMTVADGKSVRFGAERETSGSPEWAPDSKSLAYRGHVGDKSGLVIARADGTGARFIAELPDTNAPLPGAGKSVAWSPDGKRIAFVASTPGPETAAATGDPVVITRYLYKPDAAEGLTHFNDNRRLHLFVVDVASGKVDQLTTGNHYEHSVDWSPTGDELLFLTNRDADEDEFFNYDIFTMKLADRSIRRVTATESNEYHPRWSPDGKMIAFDATKRGLTDRETTMEDTHAWVVNADGSGRREIGAGIDNRQGPPEWAPDSSALLFTVQDRGNTRLYRVALSCGAGQAASRAPAVPSCPVDPLVKERGAVGAFSLVKDTLAYTFATPADQAELYIRAGSGAPRRVTDLNASLLAGKTLAEVEAFTFVSNDNKFEVEAFLTKPAGIPSDAAVRFEPWDLSVDCEHSRRASRTAGAGIQFQESGIRRSRMGHAHGELPRIDRLRAGLHGCGFRRSERQRRPGRALRSERRAAALSLDRSRPVGD